MPRLSGPGRRGTDGSVPVRLVAGLRSRVARLDAVVGGRWLLACTGVGMSLATPLLNPSGQDWLALGIVVELVTGLLALSTLVDWRRLPERATLAFPLAVFATMVTYALFAPDFTSALGGLLSGAYIYTGLTQRMGTSLIVVPCGSATLVVMNGGLTGSVAVRALISAMVWTTVVETLAAFTNEQRRLTAALTRAAMSDALTGVANRRDLDTRLAGVAPGDAVVLCDLDNFKELNDTRGHRAGDGVLADFGTLLRVNLRDGDYCARYGGEEFLLLLPDTSIPDALTLVRRLRASWTVMDSGVTFSAGISTCRADRSVAATIAGADRALYAAKAAGRNTDRVEAADTDRLPSGRASGVWVRDQAPNSSSNKATATRTTSRQRSMT